MTGIAGIPTGIVIASNAITLQECGLYRSAAHWQPVLDTHHVCPESWFVAAGKPVVSPKALICPNCHYSTHAAIDGLVRGVSIAEIEPRCRKLAEEAFVLAAAAGLKPAPTL